MSSATPWTSYARRQVAASVGRPHDAQPFVAFLWFAPRTISFSWSTTTSRQSMSSQSGARREGGRPSSDVDREEGREDLPKRDAFADLRIDKRAFLSRGRRSHDFSWPLLEATVVISRTWRQRLPWTELPNRQRAACAKRTMRDRNRSAFVRRSRLHLVVRGRGAPMALSSFPIGHRSTLVSGSFGALEGAS